MYEAGQPMIQVRDLLLKAFICAWKKDPKGTTQEEYITSSINVIEKMQVDEECIYCEEGLGLNDGDQVDHLEDYVTAQGAWVYYGVSEENFFLLQHMPSAEEAEQKVLEIAAKDPGSLSFVTDLLAE